MQAKNLSGAEPDLAYLEELIDKVVMRNEAEKKQYRQYIDQQKKELEQLKNQKAQGPAKVVQPKAATVINRRTALKDTKKSFLYPDTMGKKLFYGAVALGAIGFLVYKSQQQPEEVETEKD